MKLKAHKSLIVLRKLLKFSLLFLAFGGAVAAKAELVTGFNWSDVTTGPQDYSANFIMPAYSAAGISFDTDNSYGESSSGQSMLHFPDASTMFSDNSNNPVIPGQHMTLTTSGNDVLFPTSLAGAQSSGTGDGFFFEVVLDPGTETIDSIDWGFGDPDTMGKIYLSSDGYSTGFDAGQAGLGIASETTVRLYVWNAADGGTVTFADTVDDLHFYNAVPEPSSSALVLLAGGVGILVRRRQNQN